MTVRIHDERGSLPALAPRWRELLDADPAASLFQTPEYAGVWWEEFGALRSLAVVEIAQGSGTLTGIAPLSMEPDGSVHFVGDPSITDYLAPVARPEDRDAVATTLVEAGLALDGFTAFRLSGLPADSGWPEALGRAAKAAGLSVAEEPEDVCPVIELGGSWDAYLASISGKQRHEIRRKARRLAEQAPYTVRLSDAESLDRDLDAFFAMHRSAEGPKGKFMHENMALYFRRLAHTMLDCGWLRFALMDLDGKPVAGIYGFSDGRTWSVYNSAYDHAARELAPGMVLVAETIELAAGEGCGVFDFLRGAEPYKYRFGAVDRPVHRIVATPA